MKHAARAWSLAIMLYSAVSAADAPVAEHGKEVFQTWCAPCHAPGVRHPGTLALQAKYKGALPAALEERKALPPDLIRAMVREGINTMPSFRKTEISDAELQSLIEYLNRAR